MAEVKWLDDVRKFMQGEGCAVDVRKSIECVRKAITCGEPGAAQTLTCYQVLGRAAPYVKYTNELDLGDPQESYLALAVKQTCGRAFDPTTWQNYLCLWEHKPGVADSTLAAVYWEQERIEESVALFESCVASVDNALVRVNLFLLYDAHPDRLADAPVKAEAHLRRAVELKHPFAMYKAGEKINDMSLMAEAAELGDISLQTRLGCTYLRAHNYVQARMWLGRAATNGCGTARVLLREYCDERL